MTGAPSPVPATAAAPRAPPTPASVASTAVAGAARLASCCAHWMTFVGWFVALAGTFVRWGRGRRGVGMRIRGRCNARGASEVLVWPGSGARGTRFRREGCAAVAAGPASLGIVDVFGWLASEFSLGFWLGFFLVRNSRSES